MDCSSILLYPRVVVAHNYLAEWRNAGGVSRRGIAALGYALLTLAAVVEAVAKAALTIFFAGAFVTIGCIGLFVPRLIEVSLKCLGFAYSSYGGALLAFGSSFDMLGTLFQNLFFQRVTRISI